MSSSLGHLFAPLPFDPNVGDSPSSYNADDNIELPPMSDRAVQNAQTMFNAPPILWSIASHLEDSEDNDALDLLHLAEVNSCTLDNVTGEFVRYKYGHDYGNFLGWALGQATLKNLVRER